MKALKSLKFNLLTSIGIWASFLHADKKLNPINNPPLAKTDVFKKFLLLKFVLFSDFIFVVLIDYDNFSAANFTAFSILL